MPPSTHKFQEILKKMVRYLTVGGVQSTCFVCKVRRTTGASLSTCGDQRGESTEGEEEMDHEEMEEDSTSTCQYSRLTVLSLRVRETLRLLKVGIPLCSEHVRGLIQVNRHIQDYGLVSPERVKNLMFWSVQERPTHSFWPVQERPTHFFVVLLQEIRNQADLWSRFQPQLEESNPLTICLADQD